MLLPMQPVSSFALVRTGVDWRANTSACHGVYKTMTQGICKTCGCVCVLDETWEAYGCHKCRAARVAEAFKPLDTLRTALAVKGVHWHGEEYYKPEPEQVEETPKGLRMPKSEEAQTYELRRMFRL